MRKQPHRIRTGQTGRWGTASGLVTILLAGALLSGWLVERSDRAMRGERQRQTEQVVRALDRELVQALTGTTADLASPAYQRVKQGLCATRAAIPDCRFLYLMGHRPDGQICFLVDSEPVGSKDYSPPGQAFHEASTGLRQLFATANAWVEGPVTDSWGTWISALVPIAQPPASPMAVLLGMDIAARDWNRLLLQAAQPALYGTLMLLTLLLVAKRLLGWRARHAGVPPHWMWHLEPALALAFGLTLTSLVIWMVHNDEERNRDRNFQQLASARADAVTETFRTLERVELASLASFFQYAPQRTEADFACFTRYLMKNPTVQAWEWVFSVPALEKSRFEAEVAACGMLGFTIWQKNAHGGPESASGRDTYYPVVQIAPLSGNEQARGYDLGSEPVRRAALEEAARTGLPTATAPVVLVQETERQKSLLIFLPIPGQETPALPRGFALASLRMEQLLQNLPADEATLLELALVRPTAPPDPLASAPSQRHPLPAGLTTLRPLLAFGKVFAITVHASPEFMRQHPLRLSWLVGLAGVGLTLALVIILQVLNRRRENLEQLVAERNQVVAELRESNRQLQEATARASELAVQADAANKAKRECLANMSHELGTPRSAMIGVIPAPPPALPPAAPRAAPAATPAKPAVPPHAARLLLAEDNPVNRFVTTRQLQKLGYAQVVAVNNGNEALTALETERFDLILMDFQMPELDGEEATRRIRVRERNGPPFQHAERIPIIAMTANALKGDRERCQAAGMDDYISKPVHLEELVRVMKQWTGAAAMTG